MTSNSPLSLLHDYISFRRGIGDAVGRLIRQFFQALDSIAIELPGTRSSKLWHGAGKRCKTKNWGRRGRQGGAAGGFFRFRCRSGRSFRFILETPLPFHFQFQFLYLRASSWLCSVQSRVSRSPTLWWLSGSCELSSRALIRFTCEIQLNFVFDPYWVLRCSWIGYDLGCGVPFRSRLSPSSWGRSCTAASWIGLRWTENSRCREELNMSFEFCYWARVICSSYVNLPFWCHDRIFSWMDLYGFVSPMYLLPITNTMFFLIEWTFYAFLLLSFLFLQNEVQHAEWSTTMGQEMNLSSSHMNILLDNVETWLTDLSN